MLCHSFRLGCACLALLFGLRWLCTNSLESTLQKTCIDFVNIGKIKFPFLIKWKSLLNIMLFELSPHDYLLHCTHECCTRVKLQMSVFSICLYLARPTIPKLLSYKCQFNICLYHNRTSGSELLHIWSTRSNSVKFLRKSSERGT
jgi:hypothetical protein